ncbi:type I pullulanase [soil metagenome]
MLLRYALLFVACSVTAVAQSFTQEERLQGYAQRGDSLIFVFDGELYGHMPERVVVTGQFRGWSHDMADPEWLLGPSGSVWTTSVSNPNFQTVPPGSGFKFRIDGGTWLDAPAGAPNAFAGNLVFLFGVEAPRLRAALRNSRAIWLRFSGSDLQRSLDPSDYRITLADGSEIPVSAVLPNEEDTALLVPGEDLDIRRVHYVTLSRPEGALRSLASFDGIFRTLYSDKPLGAEVAQNGVQFRLFAPRADSVRVFVYPERSGPESVTRALARDAQGVWEYFETGLSAGHWYDYAVYGPDDPGNTFTNHTGRHVRDPYTRVSDDSWGRGRIWPRTEPATPLRNGRPSMADLIAYEVHVQDFTDLLPVGDDMTGTMPAMSVPGLRNDRGESIGIDHLADLGINAVHLLPMQEYLHYPDSVWQSAFGDDPFMQEQGVDRENYQWGYRITDFFAVEGRYRQRGTEPGAEREQFRDLVQAFHDRDIAVIVDFVFNHTGENMEGLDHIMNFNGIDRWYYYRLDENGANIGPYGNEVKSEERPMVQRWLIDQMRHFIEEFGVDGFRIDLAGATDKQSLIAIREALPEDIIIYGEPWIPPSDPDVIANPSWAWYKDDAPITFFQDDARNAFKGPVSTPRDPAVDRGFAGGDGSQRESVMLGITGSSPDERDPERGINYLDIHDNWALADQFALYTAGDCAWDGRCGVDEAAYRLAATLLMTSLGPVVLHGGVELMRSKGLAPHPDEFGGERILTTEMGPIYLKGRGDTYNLRAANRFLWENVGATPEEGARADYAGIHAFWRGLIHFRRSDLGAAFRIGRDVPEGYVQIFQPADERALGHLVDDRVLVLLNGADNEVEFSGIQLPTGSWMQVSNGTQVNHQEGFGPDVAGGSTFSRSVPPRTALIWVRR